MLISYEWLKEITDTRLSPAELRERLTMVGLAIDAVEEHNGDAVLDVLLEQAEGDRYSQVEGLPKVVLHQSPQGPPMATSVV